MKPSETKSHQPQRHVSSGGNTIMLIRFCLLSRKQNLPVAEQNRNKT